MLLTIDQFTADTTPVQVTEYIPGSLNTLSFPTGGRTYNMGGHRMRSHQYGLATSYNVRINSLGDYLDNTMKFAIFRRNLVDGDWESIAVSDTLLKTGGTPDLVAGQWNVLTATQLGSAFMNTVIEIGDVFAVYAEGDGTSWGDGIYNMTNGGLTEDWQMPFANSDETANPAWDSDGISIVGNCFQFYVEMASPLIVVIGDSLPEGATSGGTNVRSFANPVTSGVWEDVDPEGNIAHALAKINPSLVNITNHAYGSTLTHDWIPGHEFATDLGNVDLMQAKVLDYHPKVVIIGNLGINDIGSAVTWATARVNYITIFQTLLANDIIPIMCTILQNPPDNGTSTPTKRAAIIEWNQNLKILCRDMHIVCVDAYSVLADPADSESRNADLFGTNSSIHPTAPAYVAIAKTILAAMSSSYPQIQMNVVDGVVESNLKQINDTTAPETSGVLEVDLTQIDGETTVDGDANLLLNKVNVTRTDDGPAVHIEPMAGNNHGVEIGSSGSGDCVRCVPNDTGQGMVLLGSTGLAATIITAISNATITNIPAKLLAYFRLAFRKDAAVETDAAPELTAINANEGAGAGTYTSQEDSQQAIRDNIVAASPQTHSAESSQDTENTGTVDSGTYVDTATINNTYWQLSPVTPAVGGFGLSMDLVFNVGNGLDRVPSAVNIDGYADSNPNRVAHVWVYNYFSTAWDQLSDSGSAIQNGSSNSNYQYSLQNSHIQTSDGEVKIRFTMVSTTTGDDLFLDYVGVSSVAVEAAGLTAEAIAQAVHSHNVSDHTDHNSSGFRTALGGLLEQYPITTSDTALSFTCSSLPAITNNFKNYLIRVHDVTNERYADSWIASMDDSGVVILGKALPWTPDTSAELDVINGIIPSANVDPTIAVAAMLAATGVTAGGTWSFAKLMKVSAAFGAGKWQDKSGSPGTRELLDPDDGTTVVAEVIPSETSPYVSVSILI